MGKRKRKKLKGKSKIALAEKAVQQPKKEELVGRVVSLENDWYGSVATGLTPATMARVLNDAISGNIYAQMILFDEMLERDTHLFSVLQTRKLAVVNQPFTVMPAGEDSSQQKQAEVIQEVIENLPDFHDDLQDLLDAIGKGFSILEIEWDYRNNMLVPIDLHYIPQHKFVPDKDDPYNKFRLLTKEEQVNGIELPPYKFIQHIYRAKSGMPVRGGILRVAAWMYLFKHYSIRDWMIFMEIYGIPLRIGKYDMATSKEDLEVLKNAVRNLGTDAAAVISKNTEIEIIQAFQKGAMGHGPHEGLAKFCNEEISKAVLGQTETADSVPGRLGAANEKSQVRRDLLIADVRALEKRLQSDFIKPIIDLNFGPQEKYPKIKFDIEEPEDLKALAERDQILVNIGVPISKKYFYEKYGIPEPQKGDDIVFPMKEFNPFVKK